MLIETVQELLAATAPLARLTEPDPATAVADPPHVFDRLLGVATCSPAGKLSVKDKALSAVIAFGLLIVRVRLVEPFNATVAAPKALLIAGGAITVIEALALLPAPPSVDVTEELVLFFTPAVVPITLIANVHEPL